jgi:hypothetical protein
VQRACFEGQRADAFPSRMEPATARPGARSGLVAAPLRGKRECAGVSGSPLLRRESESATAARAEAPITRNSRGVAFDVLSCAAGPHIQYRVPTLAFMPG